MLIQMNILVALSLTSQFIFISRFFNFSILVKPTLSFFILVWQVYTLDRIDFLKIENTFLNRFIDRHKIIFFLLLANSFIIQLFLSIKSPSIAVAYGYGLFMGGIYNQKFPFLNFKIKSISFLKPFYITFTILSTTLLYLRTFPRTFSEMMVLIFLSSLIFLNAIIFDLKDIELDKKNNIQTLANFFPKPVFLIMIQFVCLLSLLFSLVWLPSPYSWIFFTAFALMFLASFPFYKKISNYYIFSVIDGCTAFPGIAVLLISFLSLDG